MLGRSDLNGTEPQIKVQFLLHTLISTEQTPKILHDEIYTKHWLSCWETSKFIRDKNNWTLTLLRITYNCVVKVQMSTIRKYEKIRILHTCNFAFSEIGSSSAHTIVRLKYRFDLQILCWSFTKITFLDSYQTELFALVFDQNLKIMKIMKFFDMLCLRFSKF